jgi:hypothetical protein
LKRRVIRPRDPVARIVSMPSRQRPFNRAILISAIAAVLLSMFVFGFVLGASSERNHKCMVEAMARGAS